MKTRLLVGCGDDSGLARSVGSKRGVQVELETLSEVVLCLDLSAEEVGGSPGLGEDETVGLVGVLGLELASDEVVLLVLLSGDLEGDVGRRDSLDLKVGAREVEVPAQEVIGGLAEILRVIHEYIRRINVLLAVSDDVQRTFQDGGTG